MTARGAGGPAGRGLDLRPLDPVRSIKMKLGLAVVASLAVGLLVGWLGLQLEAGAWWSLLAAVVAALLLTQVLAHGMTSPLRQMTAAVREMSAGRPVPAVATSSRDEVGELARAFTAMTQELADADAQRRELLANVAHELRTPVAALRAELENLVDGVRPADDEALRETLAQVERMGTLVDDLLDLARAEAGAERLAPEHLDVARLVADVGREVTAAHDRGPLVLDVPEGLRVWADPARLRQVLANLVDNACRHGAPDGRVEVRAVPAPGGGVRLDVLDDGPGIPEGDREAVFERFRRGSGAGATGRDGGTGLGLAIARWAVALHGGRIEVVPDAVGGHVRVELPAGPVARGTTA